MEEIGQTIAFVVGLGVLAFIAALVVRLLSPRKPGHESAVTGKIERQNGGFILKRTNGTTIALAAEGLDLEDWVGKNVLAVGTRRDEADRPVLVIKQLSEPDRTGGSSEDDGGE